MNAMNPLSLTLFVHALTLITPVVDRSVVEREFDDWPAGYRPRAEV